MMLERVVNMVRSGVVFSLILVSIIVIAGCVDAYGGLTADVIVNRTLAKYEATNDMAGEVTITTEFSGAEYLEFKDYILKKPAKFKLTEFDSGSETISDGKDVWTLDLANNVVTEHFRPHSVEVPAVITAGPDITGSNQILSTGVNWYCLNEFTFAIPAGASVVYA